MNTRPAVIPAIPHAGAADMAVQPAPELTVVIPTFKERDNVERILARLRIALAGYDCRRAGSACALYTTHW